MSEAWERQMEKTYGVLLAEHGKITAERFFPRAKGTPAGGEATA